MRVCNRNVGSLLLCAVWACGQDQSGTPLELCLPEDLPDDISEMVYRGVEVLELQTGVNAYEVVPGGHCGGAWGTVDVFVRDEDGEFWCANHSDGRKACKVWLPSRPSEKCRTVVVQHELGHVIFGSRHDPETLMAEDCAEAAAHPYFSWGHVAAIRSYFRRHQVAQDLESSDDVAE